MKGWIINCLIVVNILYSVTSPILSCKFWGFFVSQNCIMFHFWPNCLTFITSINFKCLVNFHYSDVYLFASLNFFFWSFFLYKLNFKNMWPTHILHKLILNVKLITVNLYLKNPFYKMYICVYPLYYVQINYGASGSNKIIVQLYK